MKSTPSSMNDQKNGNGSEQFLDLVDLCCFAWAARFYALAGLCIGLAATLIYHHRAHKTSFTMSVPIALEAKWNQRTEDELLAFYVKALSNSQDAGLIFDDLEKNSPEFAHIVATQPYSRETFVWLQTSSPPNDSTPLRIAKSTEGDFYNVEISLPEVDLDGRLSKQVIAAISHVAIKKTRALFGRFQQFGTEDKKADALTSSDAPEISTSDTLRVINQIWVKRLQEEARIRTMIYSIEARLKATLMRGQRAEAVKEIVLQPGDRPREDYIPQLLGVLEDSKLLSSGEINRIQVEFAKLQTELHSVNLIYDALLQQDDLHFLRNFVLPTPNLALSKATKIPAVPLFFVEPKILSSRIESGTFIKTTRRSAQVVVAGGLLGVLSGIVLYGIVAYFLANRERLLTGLQNFKITPTRKRRNSLNSEVRSS